eukprot:COSAG02_NODE_7881_length_2805_cov_1.717664_2_plen_64_part_00
MSTTAHGGIFRLRRDSFWLALRRTWPGGAGFWGRTHSQSYSRSRTNTIDHERFQAQARRELTW